MMTQTVDLLLEQNNIAFQKHQEITTKYAIPILDEKIMFLIIDRGPSVHLPGCPTDYELRVGPFDEPGGYLGRTRNPSEFMSYLKDYLDEKKRVQIEKTQAEIDQLRQDERIAEWIKQGPIGD